MQGKPVQRCSPRGSNLLQFTRMRLKQFGDFIYTRAVLCMLSGVGIGGLAPSTDNMATPLEGVTKKVIIVHTYNLRVRCHSLPEVTDGSGAVGI